MEQCCYSNFLDQRPELSICSLLFKAVQQHLYAWGFVLIERLGN